MAVNPLAARSSDQNTLSMSDLLRIPVGSRVSAAASSSTFVEMIINSLTPIQVAQAFPSYYRDAIPDVSNFITKNIDAKMAGSGRSYDQTGGGSYQETSQQYYSGEQSTSTIPTKKAALPGWLQRLQTETGMTLSNDTTGLGNRSTTAQQNKQLFLDALNKGGITDPQMRAAMAAVTEGESRFMPRSEQDYSNTDNRRIREIFSSVRGMSDANLTELKKNPEAFFNKVYGGRLGNAADEGYKYRGRGYFQLTGKENYARYGKMLGIDLVGNPDLANDPQIAAQIAVAYINDRYSNAPGKTVAEKVFRAVGNPVAETEVVKKNAFNTYMQSEEFAPGKVANLSDIDVQAAEASEAEPVGELPAGLDQKIVDYYNKQSPKRQKEILGMIKKIGGGDTTTGASKLNTLLNDPATVALDNQTSAEAIAAASVGIPLGERIIQQSVQFFSNEQGEFVGANENRNNQKIMEYLSKSGQGWDARGKKNAWCARFVNAALADAGIQSYKNTVTARDYLKWGSKVELDALAAGDVLVEHKGRREGQGGHVGFFSGRVRTKQTGSNFISIDEARKNGYDITTLQMYGGNQSDSVSFKEITPREIEGRRAPEVIADNEARRLAAAEKVQNEVNSAEVKQIDQTSKDLVNEGSQEQAATSSLDQTLQNVPTEEGGGSTLATGGKVLAPREENLRITDESGKILAYANDKEVFSVDKNGDLLVEPTYYVDPSVKNKKVIDGTVGALDTGGKVRNPNAKSGEMSPDEVLARAAMGETIGQGILDTAMRIKGLDEVKDRKKIEAFLNKGGAGLNPQDRAWCAALVNSSIKQYSKETGIDMSIAPISPKSPEEFKKIKNSTYTQYATSYLEWGQEVPSGEMLMAGDVLIDTVNSKGQKVKPHTTGGHVGLSTGNTRINPDTGELEYEMYGGNQGRGEDVQNNDPTGGMASVLWRKASELTVRRSNEQVAQLEEMKARGLPIYANKEAYQSAQYEKAMASREGSLPEETTQTTENLKGDLEQTAKPMQTAQAMAQGGFINEKDNLSVVNEDGATLAKINEGEMVGGMLTEGTGMRVVSNKTRLADDIVERNNIDSPVQQAAMQQPDAAPQKPPVMAKNQMMKEDSSWREMAANDSHQRGTQIRAFRRTKFMPEGYHFNRASPSSIA